MIRVRRRGGGLQIDVPPAVFAATIRHLGDLVAEAERRRPRLTVEPDLSGEVVAAIAELADALAPGWRRAVRLAARATFAPGDSVALTITDYEPRLAERLLELISTADRLSEAGALPVAPSLPDVRAFRRQLHLALSSASSAPGS